jgi:hypothetical protein
MIAAPWYLLSIGIMTLIAGYFLAVLTQPPRPRAIDATMSDEEIAKSLQSRERGSWAGLVVLAGYLLIGISLVWRILRWIF